MKPLYVSLVAMLAMSTGRATLFADEKTPVSINSEPAGAEVWVDGVRVGTTPTVLPLKNSREHVVTFKMAGHTPTSCVITASIGAGWLILDVVGGFVPVLVDAATGNWKKLDKSLCHGVLPRHVVRTPTTPRPSQPSAVRTSSSQRGGDAR